MKISVKLSDEKTFATSNKQDGLRMMQKWVKKGDMSWEVCFQLSRQRRQWQSLYTGMCDQFLVPKAAVLKVGKAGIGMVILYSGLGPVDKHFVGKV